MKGRAYTKEEKQRIIRTLQPHLELGYSRNKACQLVGIPAQSLSDWLKDDEALRIEVQAWESTIDTMVMANIRDAIKKEGEMQDDLKKENSWQWAKRKMKDQGFSERTEMTGAEGAALPTPILAVVDPNKDADEVQ